MRSYNWRLGLLLALALFLVLRLAFMAPIRHLGMTHMHRVPTPSWRLMRRYQCPKDLAKDVACVGQDGLNWDYRWSRVQ